MKFDFGGIFLRGRVGFRWATAALGLAWAVAATAAPVTFVFTSDVHFGITRANFRGETNVAAPVVNAALVRAVNSVSAAVLPADGGVRAGQTVGPVDFAVITGDLANRQELYPIHIQSATASWADFRAGWIDGLALKTAAGGATPLLFVPGNHDVSNAIGSPSKLLPATDPTSLVEIYNRMMRPAEPRTKETYRYATDKVYFSRDFGGAHCVYLTIWPDSKARAWIEADLKTVPAGEPVFIFCHDPPAVDARHFTNPYGAHDINSRDKFENVLDDIYADAAPAAEGDRKPDGPTVIEQRALAAFLKAHPAIVGYFHGHTNFTEFYTWKGPDGDLALAVFRADSPMKGNVSGKDERKLAFNVVAYDVAAGRLTARECLWNTSADASAGLTWGASATVGIKVPARP